MQTLTLTLARESKGVMPRAVPQVAGGLTERWAQLRQMLLAQRRWRMLDARLCASPLGAGLAML